jgi:hypothetical protein
MPWIAVAALLGSHNPVTGHFPAAHSTLEGLGIFETLSLILFCPPGRRRFLRSGAIEDDLAIFGMGVRLRLEFIKGNSSLQVVLLELLRVVIGAYQQGPGI